MNDSTALLAGHSNRYQIPLSHFEYKFIQNCADGKELERIYKELKAGELGSFPELEKLTLERLQQIKPNSHLLRQDKAPLDQSALPDDEREDFTNFLQQMKKVSPNNTVNDHSDNGIESVPIRNATTIKSTPPVQSTATTNNNGKAKRVTPRSYDEWGKLEKDLEAEENDEEEKKKPVTKSPATKTNQVSQQQVLTAEDHRLNGNNAFKTNNYQQSIESYSQSIALDQTNTIVYMNRAIAHYKLNNYDASLNDCSHVLSKEPNHIKALFRRASCHIAKQRYNDAKADLDFLLGIEPNNTEAKNLLKTIPIVPQARSVRIPITEEDSDDEETAIPPPPPPVPAPVKIPILEVDEEDDDDVVMQQDQETQPIVETPGSSTNIDIPSRPISYARPGIDSQEASPATFDHYLDRQDEMNQFQHEMQYQLDSLDRDVDSQRQGNNDDDDIVDDMELGDEAGASLIGNMSDDEGHVSRSFNVSPTAEDDNDDTVPELIDHKPLQTPPMTPSTHSTNTRDPIDRPIVYRVDNTYNQRHYPTQSHQLRDTNADNNFSTRTNNFSARTNSSYLSRTNDLPEQSPQLPGNTNVQHEQINNSSFSPTIQTWLRDTVDLQSSRRPSSYHERPWSRSMRPYSLDKLQRDIERFNRLSDFRNAVEASKKMLKNGVLDYHSHAEHIVNVLIICAQCYAKVNNHFLTIQYASEALQYNKTDSSALLCRAKAFEEEKFLLLSYADYARIPSNDQSYPSAQNACQRLAIELSETEDDEWRNQIPSDSDDERFLSYVKSKNPADQNLYEWYRTRANQLYLDACFILSIRCYTYCVELQPNLPTAYLNRAACYLKVFEPQKAIEDCDRSLQLSADNPRAIYRKASAYKMIGDHTSYTAALKDLIQLQPNNQVVLSEYYSARQEAIPRRMRRLRTAPAPATTTAAATGTAMETTNSSSSIPEVSINATPSTSSIVNKFLGYDDLERLRGQKAQAFSANVAYQFTNQLGTLKSTDIEGQCSLFLRIPNKSLYQFVKSATPTVIETIIRVCRTMVDAEKRYQQEHKSAIVSFSYIQYSFQLLVQLTSIPRLDSALAMIDGDHRAALDELLSYYSAISSTLNDVNKLERLRK